MRSGGQAGEGEGNCSTHCNFSLRINYFIIIYRNFLAGQQNGIPDYGGSAPDASSEQPTVIKRLPRDRLHALIHKPLPLLEFH
jgi:hypothetical protein